MADKLLIVMMNADPEDGPALVPPLNQACIAAAMEFEVEIVFTGRAGRVIQKGVAARTKASEHSDKTVYDVLKEAHNAGVKIKACAPVIEEIGDDTIEELDEIVGGAYIISEAMDADTVTFTY
ncbi:MAG: DsrE family protein [Gammaproteobacteria bacterium]|nr:DsrE family protein [Gammaproteobacteria bacterium]MDH5613589.1 DsrE family protein [Gammaproteobacteria bacterium]